MKTARRLLVVLLILAGLAAIAYEAGRRILASQFVAHEVTDRLAKLYGGTVNIDNVDISSGGSSIGGLKLYEVPQEGHAARPEPWFTASKVDSDVTLWDAIRGALTVHRLTFHGASVHLRFDKDGRLVTQLPTKGGEQTAVPDIRIVDGRMVLHQEGRPEMTITGVDATVHNESGSLVLIGTINDPTWGKWALAGDWNRGTESGSARLTCPKTRLTQKRVEEIPMISSSVWAQVNGLDGDVRADLELSVLPGLKKTNFTVTLEAINVAIHIPSIDLSGDLVGGSVVVEGAQVEIRKLVGKTAGGELITSGKLDFRDEKQTKLDFAIDARKLDLTRLPSRWGLPRQITGDLSTVGTAKLELTIRDGKLATDGQGDAIIRNAKLAGDPLNGPIEIKLRPSAKGFQFATNSSAALDRTALEVQVMTALIAEPETKPVDWIADLPLTITNTLATGLDLVIRSIVNAGHEALSAMPTHVPPKPAADQPGYLQVKMGLENVDLAPLVKNLGINLPFAVAGKLSFELQVRIPTANSRDLKSYWLDGSASMPWLMVEDMRLEDVRARVRYANGILHLEDVSGKMPTVPENNSEVSPQARAGSFKGTARLGLYPGGDLHAWLSVKAIPLADLGGLVRGLDKKINGAFSGTVSMRAPAQSLRDMATWDGVCSLSSDRLQIFGARLEKVSSVVRLTEGQVALSDLSGKLDGGAITASGGLTLVLPYGFHATANVGTVELDVLNRLDAQFRPPVPTAGRLSLAMDASGTLNPMTMEIKGKAQARQLKIDKVSVGSAAFDWDSNGKQLNLRDVSVALYRGEVTGRITLPMQPIETGSVALRFERLDLSALAGNLPPLPVKLEGRASGTLNATMPKASAKGSRDWTADMKLQSKQLKLQGIPAEAVDASFTYKNRDVAYHFEGKTLGGTFHVEGKLPAGSLTAPPPAASQPPESVQGSVRVQGVRLTRVWDWLDLSRVLGPLNGRIDIALDYKANSNGKPVGRGTFSINELRWAETRFLQDSLSGWIQLHPDEVRFGLSTSGLGGSLDLRAGINARRAPQSWFDLTIERVNVNRFLAPWPELSSHFQGYLSAHLRGSLGADWEGSGTVSLFGGSIYGIQVAEWHLPVSFAYSPEEYHGAITTEGSAVQFLSGRATGKARLTWGGETYLEGKLTFFEVELRRLLSDSAETAHFGSGLLSGQLEFGGTNMRSVDDLTASFRARLRSTEALQFPVLRQLAPYLFLNLSAATVFEDGDLRARLARGVVRIERLSLQSRLIRLFMDGTITVEQGRLDLATTISAGGLPINCQQTPLARLGRQGTQPVPVGSLLQAASNLATLVIHLQVTGTVRAPHIRIVPLRQLTEEALQFFRF